MDQNALKFIQNRQAVLRDAYNSYKLRFSFSKASLAAGQRDSDVSTSTSGGRGTWAWGQWDDNDVNEIITECLGKQGNLSGKPGAPEPNIALRDGIRGWINEFLSDTGEQYSSRDLKPLVGRLMLLIPWLLFYRFDVSTIPQVRI
jgi:hypothetical protein